ncbi:cation-translocating P-type ATPase [Fundicoccus sp. Sow4_H7]|uniref:cation-translocating P-type ATPase n=1 Tax=Fundicoccus sp. Sow4_H7 TaxID=3438784 RepID=UPI003F8F51B2
MSKENFKPFTLSADEVVSHLETDVTTGLSDAEVQRRLEKYGHNELITEEKTTLLQKFIAQFKDFMIIVLLVAAAISAVIGIMEGEGIADAIVILIVVTLNALMGVFQESKAEEAIDALRDMASPEAKVRRNNSNTSIKSTELVPGDIVLLEAGDIVPADLRLVEANSLQIEEAALTGESVASEKDILTIEDAGTGIGDRHNMAFSSTNVTYGRALGVVTATGMGTEVGNIANILSSTESQQTPLQRDQEELGKKLTYLIIIIAIITFIVGLYGPNSGEATVIDMLLISISLAVAAIPEGLPAITTIILSIGTQKMAERNALVRTLPAVETLGSTQVICSDKTGTLTVNKMTIEQVFYNGELHEASEDIDLNSPLLRAITFANDVSTDNSGNLVGDPTEIAMIKYGNDKGFDLEGQLAQTPRIDEVPFDSTRKLMSTIHKLEDGRFLVAVKGAPDQLIKRATQYQDNDQVVALTEEHSQSILQANENMARNALRVLAGAYKIIDSLPEKVDTDTVENDLIFAGLVGMIDPERKEAGDAIKVAHDAGIRTVMITGDHAVTAQAIAERLGILNPNEDNASHVITGADLDSISDDELARTVSNYSVYARVSPEHKVRIIRAWQANDVVVSMTGDGVNDAPSLKQADIGVGMGITGTEVSKGASDMVLADDNFETIVVAVEEGRKVFANIQKAVQFLLSANMGEVLTLFIATFMGWTILEPIHILWINLVTDVFPAIALGMEDAESDSMRKAPRTSKDNFLSFGILPSIIYQGIIEGGLTLFVYWYARFQMGVDNNMAETMAFITLGLIQLFHAYNVKSTFKSLFSSNPFDNKFLNLAFFGSGALLLGVILIPGINTYFDVTVPTTEGWLVSLLAAASIIVIVELVKWILRATGVAARYEKPGSENIQ